MAFNMPLKVENLQQIVQVLLFKWFDSLCG